jgi:hypothetical protein
MADVYAAELKRAVEAQHGCKATVFQSVPLKETFGGKTVWEGIIYICRRLHRRRRRYGQQSWPKTRLKLETGIMA